MRLWTMEPLGPRRISSHQQKAASRHRIPTALDRIESAIAKRSGKGSTDASTAQLDDVAVVVGNYEYLDHTADIQLHSWGESFSEALADIVLAMFGYMTDLRKVEATRPCCQTGGVTSEVDTTASTISVSGHDKESLVFNTMQELLTRFHEDHFVVRTLNVVNEGVANEMHFAELMVLGEVFDDGKHTAGTEVKAVTYSNLNVKEEGGRWDIWVIVDI
jgi:SHS2 domain-containing protein